MKVAKFPKNVSSGKDTHGPCGKSMTRPTGKMKSGLGTSTHCKQMPIVQQSPGK